ncbi:pseudouridine synthase [bacterium]|nr:pseudouridine synthase [bacterium]
MTWTRTFTGDEPQRVNKWLARAGVCSRREAEALIAQGLVSIDGERIADPGRKIAAGQTLTLAEGAVSRMEAQVTIVLNKPVGFVSAQPEGEQIPAARLVRRETIWRPDPPIGGSERPARAPDAKASLAPLGRLDQDSRGLLLLSQDGVLAKAVIGPDSRLEKEYRVTVSGRIDRAKLQRLRHGLELDGRKLRPAKVTIEDDQVLRFVLNEGRKRQIRRMCELVELEVADLIRTRIGPILLGDLPEGRWRLLAADERTALITAAKAA